VEVADPLLLRADFLDKAIARYTGEEAVSMGVDRLQQDRWAVSSHRKYFEAEAKGYFEFERFPIRESLATLAADEGPRCDVSEEKLGDLSPVYQSPTITAGNAPGLNDGAAFILLASRSFAIAHGLRALAIIHDYVQVAGGPTTGSHTPAVALGKILDRTRRSVSDLTRIEINEAFAATPLVSALFLAKGDRRGADGILDRTNLCGGAVAIGHPIGASGARLVMTLVNGLRLSGGLGVAAICGGYGQGDATLIEAA
jgi:acetyl-CoA C-acetyltransferase